jgi:hypothetical protein
MRLYFEYSICSNLLSLAEEVSLQRTSVLEVFEISIFRQDTGNPRDLVPRTKIVKDHDPKIQDALPKIKDAFPKTKTTKDEFQRSKTPKTNL